MSLLQAAAAGVPLIGTDVGGIPEIIHNRENGILVPPGDIDRLREALLYLLAEEELARRWGDAGRQIVADEFSIDAMVEGNYHVYQSLYDEK